MKTLSLTEIEAKTAREQDTNLFKSDLEMILGQSLKGFKAKDFNCPGAFEGVESTLKMLIADLALNLHWQFDENITVKGLNGFNCAFALQSIGFIAERWGKEPKQIGKGYETIPLKSKPENCTRHLKFGLWFKAIKDGIVKVENDKVLKLVGYEGENKVFCEFGKYFQVSNIPNFKPYVFNAFSLQNTNGYSYACTNETGAFIQFYHQITRK